METEIKTGIEIETGIDIEADKPDEGAARSGPPSCFRSGSIGSN